MNIKRIVILLIPINIILAYYVFNSIKSEMDFQKIAKERIDENIQKLKDLRQIQIGFKKAYNRYANNFDELLTFLNNDSLPIIKSIGERPDTLSDQEALKLGIISRDTSYVLAKQSIFDKNYQKNRDNRFQLIMSELHLIPNTEYEYNINAGSIEKGKVLVQVFEISTEYEKILSGLTGKNIDKNKVLKVGSMSEVSLNGNWGE